VGDVGQRVQGFLTRLGLDNSYVGFDAFPCTALRAAALARIWLPSVSRRAWQSGLRLGLDGSGK
jgi:hypothetical protein